MLWLRLQARGDGRSDKLFFREHEAMLLIVPLCGYQPEFVEQADSRENAEGDIENQAQDCPGDEHKVAFEET